MASEILKFSFISAIILTALLCGASLDQSIKQLPARHIIGARAFSEFQIAADLKNGVPLYAFLGIGAALTAILTAIFALLNLDKEVYKLPLLIGGILAVCHSICTAMAAPTNFSQKGIQDEEKLRRIHNKFERIQTIRSAFIVLNFACYIWVLLSL